VSGLHLLAIVAILLAATTMRATEVYTDRYHSLPVLDWLESRPPLLDSANVPPAVDLARGASRALPLLEIRNDAQTQMPVFGPPSSVQRIVGGVRDAARITLVSPGTPPLSSPPIAARFDVIVFNRTLRATAWSQLMGRAMDIRDPDSGASQLHISGPDEGDAVWIAIPGTSQGGIATVVGQRGAVGFVMQVSYMGPRPANSAQLTDLSARAEVLARAATRDWTAWLASVSQ
jgi:hypothetical protein